MSVIGWIIKWKLQRFKSRTNKEIQQRRKEDFKLDIFGC